MTAMKAAPELALPWESSALEDRRFNRILRNMLVGALVLAIVVPFLSVPELTRAKKEEVPPHLARVILEKMALPKPVPVKPKPKPVEKVEPEKPRPVEKKVENPRPIDKTRQARNEAQVSGVLAFRDDLLEMRESLDVNTLNTTDSSRGEATAAKVERSLITSASQTGSGGIKTAKLSRDTGGAALSARETTQVESAIANATEKAGQSASARLGGRSDESIRREMDRNKGAIFAIYNRALRRDPLLEGKLVFEMIIDADGAIDDIKLLSSELADEELTRKILSRIRMIRFDAKNVITTRVNYSFDFLPYT